MCLSAMNYSCSEKGTSKQTLGLGFQEITIFFKEMLVRFVCFEVTVPNWNIIFFK